MDDRRQTTELPRLSLALRGKPLLALLAGRHARINLPAAACDSFVACCLGLVESMELQVDVDGERWGDCNAWDVATKRGTMGWTLIRSAWLSNFSVIENVTLQARHHSRHRDADIIGKADAFAQRLGLPAVPRERPHLCDPDVLRRCEWIRAVMNEPELLLLAQPEGMAVPWAAQLGELVAAACPAAAVLWIYPIGVAPVVPLADTITEVVLTEAELPPAFTHLFE